MVVHAEISAGSKRHFSCSQFELAIDLGQMTEDNLFELNLRSDAASFNGLRRQAIRSSKHHPK